MCVNAGKKVFAKKLGGGKCSDGVEKHYILYIYTHIERGILVIKFRCLIHFVGEVF